jgi:ubiquinone/menaquinone biosynthesis C-methylase UbiE
VQVLDAGTGNGALVRLMREHNKNAYGIELSRAVLEKECPDMLAKGYVEPGILTNLPYEDNSFDIVRQRPLFTFPVFVSGLLR